ncbi:F0F1 ATP synthase subunit delta [Planococcus sp. N028]|uniref:ATP synthase subunit delta n=1 Tax=Planococcus shixiaomingii TaxID=3058393 RepID=A0ABT8N1L4_9BACL|nr:MULTISPECIES: F0F1 ATP synthase subunit delta [unclassified Planococcus (in: firmicutes)]MDN7241783.1 F0F1 ATP synthase subunit delta [Planococcus sp. N028]WKA54068.1 F0F1 ATP synthase subunit delta [Planococcus sp. N022]
MSQVSERYALALFQSAKQHEVMALVEEDLRVVKRAFIENPELKNLINSPKLTSENKREIMTQLFGQANVFVVNTLLLMGERKRLNEVVGLVDAYIRLANEEQGIADAKVFSVRPLSEEERTSVSSVFAKKVGKQALRIENIIDPSLIGGMRIQIGNQIYDSSISSKLERLQRQLIG